VGRGEEVSCHGGVLGYSLGAYVYIMPPPPIGLGEISDGGRAHKIDDVGYGAMVAS
jgi:hypothetical protein